MSDSGTFHRVCSVRFERILPGPVGRVWQHLTEPAKLTAWYGKESVIEPKEGGRVSLMDGHIRGIVTQWVPERKLIHSWNVFSPGNPQSAYPESYLSIELAGSNPVMLTLLHLPVLERFEKQNAMGWHTFLDILEDTLAGRIAAPRMDYMQRNARVYGVDLGNLAR